jgi:pre-mRNA-splicing factor 38A
MANSTDPFAQSVHGTNPQYLIEKITRQKIYNCTYWKEQCFGLTAETIIDKAIALKYCGGTYGGNLQPTNFLCLVLKMLQLQPEIEIVLEYVKNEDFKYLRALGAFYLRLVGKTDMIYQYLEPLLNDYRKLAYRGMSGWQLMHMDEFVDSLLRDELVCDMALPHLVKRMKLEELGTLLPRKSVLDDEIANAAEEDSESSDESDSEQDNGEDGEVDEPAAAHAPPETQSKTEKTATDVLVSSEQLTKPADTNNYGEKQDRKVRPSEPDDNGRGAASRHKDRDGSQEGSSRERGRRDAERSRDSRRDDSREGRSERRRHSPGRSRSASSDSYDARRHRRRDRSGDRDRHRRRGDSRDRRRDRDDSRDRHRDRDAGRGRDSRDRDGDRRRADRRDDRRRSRSRSPYRRRSPDRDRNRDRDRHREGRRGRSPDRRKRDRSPSSDRDHKRSKDSAPAATAAPVTASVEEEDDWMPPAASEPVPAATATKTKDTKTASERKFDRMFGKSKPSQSGAGAGGRTAAPASSGGAGNGRAASNGGGGGGKEIVNSKGEKVVITASEGTVEYWNQMREALGLKKLK